jgi:hypothetical protein
VEARRRHPVRVNAGAEIGLKNGDRLTIERISKTFTNPATGQVLAQRKIILGTVELTNVKAKLASGPYVAIDQANNSVRGDLVEMNPYIAFAAGSLPPRSR